MQRHALALLLTFTLTALGDEQYEFGDSALTVPDGFEVDRVAGPPLVDFPVCADFDERGYLYVADQSSGSSAAPTEQFEKGLNRIVRLEDTDGDGRFDARTIFADHMGFSEGVLCHAGSVFVTTPPVLWRLTDTDDDGIADVREEWLRQTVTGCANDLHGPFLGLDGWIYWAKGAFAKQTHSREGREPFVTRAAHIFRARTDGGDVEPVMTGGMDNPVEVVFTERGERIFTTTFLQHPGGGARDGLIHAIYGGVYGKSNQVLDDHKRTGNLMPVLTHLGPAAPCGLARYDSHVFGEEFRSNLFACCFNLRKVTRHVLEPDGATFRTRDSDFLVSDSVDFHPTDVVEDADGSLLVLDTGGWYRLCCPTSQLQKPDILGAIYRIRRKDAPPLDDPRGQSIAWKNAGAAAAADIAALLGDARPAVRKRAISELAERDQDAIHVVEEVLRNSASSVSRRNAVWTLTRIDSSSAREAVRLALHDADEGVRHAAIHSVGVHRDSGARGQLVAVLRDDSPAIRRAAAEALGRLEDARAVPALLEASSDASGRVLEHSLTYALIEIAAPAETTVGLSSPNPRTQRAAAIALDQMDGGIVDPLTAVSWLGSSDETLKMTATWLVTRHPEWGPDLATFLKKSLLSTDSTTPQRIQLARILTSSASHAAVRSLLHDAVANWRTRDQSAVVALQAMGRAGLKPAPSPWSQAIASALGAKNPELILEAVATASRLQFGDGDHAELSAGLLRIANDTSRTETIRLQALSSVPGRLPELPPELFDFVRSSVSPSKLVQTRSRASQVLAKTTLNRAQLITLTDALVSAGPLDLPGLARLFRQQMDDDLGQRLLGALEVSIGRAGLRGDELKALIDAVPEALKSRATQLNEQLERDAKTQRGKLTEILDALPEGDIRRGQLVFRSEKAACYACHEIGYIGGDVGPDLTRVGKIRTEADLLEALLFPSATIAQSYEPVLVITDTGETHNGILREDTQDELVLATGPTAVVRVARSDIASVQASQVSVMPTGLDKQLSSQELADLLAFLKASQ